jgi:hypothetical protein
MVNFNTTHDDDDVSDRVSFEVKISLRDNQLHCVFKISKHVRPDRHFLVYQQLFALVARHRRVCELVFICIRSTCTAKPF